MNTRNRSESKNKQRTVDEIIDEIKKKAADGDYIFRGEVECHDEVSSNLYRELEKFKVNYSDIAEVQAEIVDEAKCYTYKTDDFEILTEIQHYGGKTNLIDFTTDYKVALFFAATGYPDRHGRIIILRKTKAIEDMIRIPCNSVKRATDQKSIFVQPPKGYIERERYEVIFIPKDLKLSMLRHLHGCKISSETIYNDIHGFISRENAFWMAYRQFDSGLTSQNKRDYEKAIEYYTNALEQGLRLPEVYNNRGNVNLKIGKVNNAIDDFNEAIQLKPDFAEVYVNRGNAYSDIGKVNDAINDYNTAIKLNSDFAEAYNNRGNMHLDVNHVDNAIDDFSKAIELDPDYAGAYSNRGRAYLIKRNLDFALKDFNYAIQLKPDDAEFNRHRSVAYSIKGNFEGAIKDLNKAIKLNSNDANTYFLRGTVYTNKREFNKAIDDFNKSIELEQDYANAYFCRGIVWLHLRNWREAKADLTSAKNLGMDITAAFHNSYRDVATFERRNDVKMPKDIVAMLMQYPINPFTTTQKVVTHDREIRESAAVLELLEKFRNAGKPLHEHLQEHPSRGITTGYNEAFVVGRATRDALIAEHLSSADILKPFLMAHDIKRWQVKPQDKWLIFAHQGIDIDAYPAIKKHLERYSDALKRRSGKQKWYELQIASRDTDRFEHPKCIYPEMASETAFAFDDEGYYVARPASLLPTNELWLLGVLNTKAVSWFYARTSPEIRGPFLKFTSRYVSQIPIPNMEPKEKALIHKIVEYILYLKKQPTTDGKDLANSSDYVMLSYFGHILDDLVYELYLPDELHQGDKYFFQPLLDEKLPQLEEIQGNKMFAFRELFEHLFHKDHPVQRNHFFLDSVQSIRIIESKA